MQHKESERFEERITKLKLKKASDEKAKEEFTDRAAELLVAGKDKESREASEKADGFARSARVHDHAITELKTQHQAALKAEREAAEEEQARKIIEDIDAAVKEITPLLKSHIEALNALRKVKPKNLGLLNLFGENMLYKFHHRPPDMGPVGRDIFVSGTDVFDADKVCREFVDSTADYYRQNVRRFIADGHY